MNERIAQPAYDIPLLNQSAERIACACPQQPTMCIIAGSGLANAFEHATVIARIPYHELPCLPQAGIAGHRNEVLITDIGGNVTVVFAGRFHVYEGYSPLLITIPVALAARLGVHALIATNAAGGLHTRLRVGDLVIADSIVNMTYRSLTSSARGNAIELCSPWRSRTIEHAIIRGLPIQEGTYVAVHGPSYETLAEVRFYRRVGDTIGMSTVHEIEAAALLDLQPLVVSVVTNVLTDVPRRHPLTHHEVLAASQESGSRLRQLIEIAITTFDAR
ncbi:MAG: purine-nucleoside phosphorylase [Chlorobi bacterium]|nr:purine-nucleoside phosphorylase [Chlorobiota bacterium]